MVAVGFKRTLTSEDGSAKVTPRADWPTTYSTLVGAKVDFHLSLVQNVARATAALLIKVDFHLAQNVARAKFSFCLRSSQMQPSRNLFNSNNAAVAHATFCSTWKSNLKLNRFLLGSIRELQREMETVARATFCTE